MFGWLRTWIRWNITGDDAPPPFVEPLPQDDWSQTGRVIRNSAASVVALILLGARDGLRCRIIITNGP